MSNEDLRNLSQEEADCVGEISWGNMNCIELPRTLKKEELWDSIDKEKYWDIKQFSELHIDPIENLIKAYNPDYLIILGWGGTTQHVFKGLAYSTLEKYYEEDYRALYTLKDYMTKIIWTSHPSRFSFLGTNQDEMIPYVGNSLKLFDR